MWGEKCLEHQTLKKTLGESLWKQPTTEEVLNVLDRSLMQQSIVSFPLSRSLNVSAGVCASFFVVVLVTIIVVYILCYKVVRCNLIHTLKEKLVTLI